MYSLRRFSIQVPAKDKSENMIIPNRQAPEDKNAVDMVKPAAAVRKNSVAWRKCSKYKRDCSADRFTGRNLILLLEE